MATNYHKRNPISGKTPAERFLRQLEKIKCEGCWEWRHSFTSAGYGKFRVDDRWLLSHRVSYEINVGPIPDGLQIDHKCRNRKCVNPAHMEPVTQRENILRGDSMVRPLLERCRRGHELTGDNIATDRNGERRCLICRRASRRTANRNRKKSSAPPPSAN